jgi:hypothetical protein
MKRKVPTPLLIYAFVLAMGAPRELRRGIVEDRNTWQVAFDYSHGIFMLVIAGGIFRLWRFARIAAMVYCCFFFIAFAATLLLWCVSPHSMSLPDIVLLAIVTAVQVYIYIVLRRPGIRAVFERPSANAKT